MYTSLGVITKGTIIEVNVSELGMVTQGGKVRLVDGNSPVVLFIHHYSNLPFFFIVDNLVKRAAPCPFWYEIFFYRTQSFDLVFLQYPRNFVFFERSIQSRKCPMVHIRDVAPRFLGYFRHCYLWGTKLILNYSPYWHFVSKLDNFAIAQYQPVIYSSIMLTAFAIYVESLALSAGQLNYPVAFEGGRH